MPRITLRTAFNRGIDKQRLFSSLHAVNRFATLLFRIPFQFLRFLLLDLP